MDLVITGANVLTVDSQNRRAEAVAVQDGKLAAVGASAEILKLVGPDTEVLRLPGRTLVPGFIDPHTHFCMTTLMPLMVHCGTPPHNSINSILDAISAAAKGAPKGQWIWGWGAGPAGLKENRRLTRWELDELAPDNPVCILSIVHAASANSAALRLAGINRETPDPATGKILRDDSGEPNGTLWEGATDLLHGLFIRSYLDLYGDSVADLVYENCLRHAAFGITSVADALVFPEAAEMYRTTDRLGKLPMVLHQMMGGPGFYDPPDKSARQASGDGNVSDRLRGGTIKLFMDPVNPSPALIRYHDDGRVEHFGERFYTQEAVIELVLGAHKDGLQVAIHCLGTWAVEQALNAFENAQREHPRPEPRHRIEHYMLPTLEQIKRTKSLGVIPNMQPNFVFNRADRSLTMADEFGGDIRVFPFKTMLSEGVTVAASSDCPASSLDPILGIYSVVTRATRFGTRIVPEEAVTPMEALRMYTMNSAYAMSRDHEVGSLEVGKRADMVVLSHDPTAIDPESIRDIHVERTYVDGKLLFERGSYL